MTFKSPLWYPVAVVVTLLNLVAVGFAAQAAEPLHAATHGALALAFGLWAQRLRRTRAGAAFATGELPDRLEALEGEVSMLREELGEAQERLDFAERVLAQIPETRRVGPER
jgi:hypothetical protein